MRVVRKGQTVKMRGRKGVILSIKYDPIILVRFGDQKALKIHKRDLTRG